APFLASRAERAGAQVFGDLLDHAEAVGTVGADRAGRSEPGPADAVDAREDATFIVGEASGALVEGHARDRGTTITDATDHEIGGDHVCLARAGRPAGLDPGALDLQPGHFAFAHEAERRGEHVEVDLDRLVRA